MTTLNKEIFVPVDQIDDEGKYKFQPKGVGNSPYFLGSEIPSQLRKSFAEIWTAKIIPCRMVDGEFLQTRVDYLPKWDGSFEYAQDGKEAIIGYAGQTYCIGHDGGSSNGSGSWWVRIEDIGNLSVVKNKVSFAQPINRDGKFFAYINGTVPHFSRGGVSFWTANINVEGKKPGTLVVATIDLINKLNQSGNYRLAKQTN